MATAKNLRRIALSLEGTSEAPHFDRTAFKVAPIYATLAADGVTANLKFTPDEQALKCIQKRSLEFRTPGAIRAEHGEPFSAERRRIEACPRNGLAARKATRREQAPRLGIAGPSRRPVALSARRTP
jgi:hypothetical protein